MKVTLQQLLTLHAVVRAGSFQGGAQALHKTHPSVITLLGKLEAQLRFALFDRSGYRTVLTEAGTAFYRQSLGVLDELGALEDLAEHLGQGNEARLRIVIGDVTPLDGILRILRDFANRYPHVQLDLSFENLAGPRERVLDGDADLMIHHVNSADLRFESQSLACVQIIPVVAPGFLDFAITRESRYDDLKRYVQCIIRDTARHSERESRFVLEGAPSMTVGDQHTKKAVILRGMAWGHMPDFMIADELEAGTLKSIAGRHIKGTEIELVAARVSMGRKGVMAERLWQAFQGGIDANAARMETGNH